MALIPALYSKHNVSAVTVAQREPRASEGAQAPLPTKVDGKNNV